MRFRNMGERKGVIISVFLTCFIFGLSFFSCGDDNAADADNRVDNTDFVASEAFSFSMVAAGKSLLKLRGVNGTINIVGLSNTDSIKVSGERSVGSESTQDARNYLQNLQVIVDDSGSFAFVKTIQPANNYGRDLNVDYNVTMPKNMAINVYQSNGLIEIDSINSDISVWETNGEIFLDNIIGNVIADLADGLIQGNITILLNGIIDFTTDNGDINLSIPENTSAHFSAAVGTGNITITNLVLTNEQVTPTQVTGTLGSGLGIISLEVGIGDIDVTGI